MSSQHIASPAIFQRLARERFSELCQHNGVARASEDHQVDFDPGQNGDPVSIVSFKMGQDGEPQILNLSAYDHPESGQVASAAINFKQVVTAARMAEEHNPEAHANARLQMAERALEEASMEVARDALFGNNKLYMHAIELDENRKVALLTFSSFPLDEGENIPLKFVSIELGVVKLQELESVLLAREEGLVTTFARMVDPITGLERAMSGEELLTLDLERPEHEEPRLNASIEADAKFDDIDDHNLEILGIVIENLETQPERDLDRFKARGHAAQEEPPEEDMFFRDPIDVGDGWGPDDDDDNDFGFGRPVAA